MASFPKSGLWDKQTRRSVNAVRAYIHREPQPTISHIQAESIQDRPLKGPFRSISDVCPAPIEDDIRQMLFRTIDDLGDIDYERPALVSVPVEWIGKDKKIEESSKGPSDKRSDLTKLASDSTHDLIIFHVHGGAYFQGSPGSYRPVTSRLASLTGGRVISVEYRLSPQNVFPAALLDVFLAYISLLYPSPDAAHGPVDPSRIVFAGDSAGGVLLFGVLQIILNSVNRGPMHFHGKEIHCPIPAPAGIAVLSLAGDLTQSLPSYETNRVHDLFLEVPWYHLDYPSCPLWPADPPRPDIYCPMSSFLHPLVTVALAESWAGAPPIWLSSGEELFVDGAKAVARRAASQNVDVTWTQYEAMPHCFPTIPGLTRSKHSQLLMENWAQFCRECVEGTPAGPPKVKASRVGFKQVIERPVELQNPGDPSFDEMKSMIETRVQSVEALFGEKLRNAVRPKL